MAQFKLPGPIGYQLSAEEAKNLRLPSGALPADTSKQKPNLLGRARYYYEDRPFTCRTCGKREVWKAESQKHWYEECQGNLEAVAVLCRACRKGEHEA